MSSNRNYRSNGGGGGGGGGGYRQHSSKVTVQMTQERAHVNNDGSRCYQRDTIQASARLPVNQARQIVSNTGNNNGGGGGRYIQDSGSRR
ncbi:hypothetical protein DERP_001377 [Dermatophagoides pteronyssinus]|uniref:Transcription factor BHLH089-like n=2 Tax=Dermatophagoides pteronyssinus TaxID=6956 RepID=A0A6P6YM99_DERPT|nr:transcription factor BHLH089-like [Dermatophagoides pteronyssinus]KAH9420938.1 hypothetical protein DERP_001377 [Dermatophagoides pteronyssinus]